MHINNDLTVQPEVSAYNQWLIQHQDKTKITRNVEMNNIVQETLNIKIWHGE